ncbi:MAG: hypothetical protein ACFFEA_09965 [Candidatus Thorarchaeota archaeon]
MQTVTLDNVRIESILEFLSRNYSRVLKKEWREGDKIYAVYVHEEFVVRTSSDQTLTTVIEYDQSAERGLCTIVGSGGRQGLFGFDWGSQSDGERTVKAGIVALIEKDEMRGKRYCFNCQRWDDYEVERGQKEVICRNCGQRIELQ